MFDVSWVADLDAASACAAITGNQTDLREQELRELLLAAHWAVLHDGESISSPDSPAPPGAERRRQLGGAGTPPLAEFACAELGLLMGTGFISADNLIRDALDLQHRHPRLWAALARGEGRVWKARKVAQLVHRAGLSLEDARTVDLRTTAYVDLLPWASFLRLVEAEIITADPAAAEQRRQARELEQFVTATPSDEQGLKTLIARAEAGDVIVFMAMCNRIAEILEVEGDTSPAGARRARAVGILGRPADALALLQRHAAVDVETTDDGEPLDLPAPCPSCGDTAALPFRIDPERVRPRAVLHVRLSAEALRSGSGVAVLVNDRSRPITVGEAMTLLGHCQVSVRPVLDLRAELPADCYEVPARMRDALRLARPSSVFPWSTSGLAADLDHTIPFVPLAAGGQPGQTRVDNLGPMNRFAHRVKTHGRGWRHRQPSPGVYLWRTPHGSWFRSDRHGSRPLAGDPADPPTPQTQCERHLAGLLPRPEVVT